MRKITEIIIHCADTYEDQDIGAKEIRQWHTAKPPKGNGWADIGYHYVIRRSGAQESGRPLEQVGAHASGHNKFSIGICLAGGKAKDGKAENNFTKGQFDTLQKLVKALMDKHPQAKVIGHCDVDSGKACPCFDVATWLKGIL